MGINLTAMPQKGELQPAVIVAGFIATVMLNIPGRNRL